MELKLGKMTNKELAQWFGIVESTFKATKAKKLEELKLFADFYEQSGKVFITEIYEPVYNRQQARTVGKVINKIDKVWSEDGLDTCQRVGSQICKMLKQEGLIRGEKTIIKYTRDGRNELYGKPFFEEGGKLGHCIYIWCKKSPDGTYKLLNSEEIKIKEDLQKKYFGDATEKQIIVEAMVESGEITRAEAWDVLRELTNMKRNFMPFLGELQEKLQCQVIRGTLVERNALVTRGEDFEDNEQKYIELSKEHKKQKKDKIEEKIIFDI